MRIEYCEALIGSTSPGASTQKLNCHVAEQVESAPYTTARLNLPENITGNRTYQVQYGRKLNFASAGSQTTALRIPAGMLTSAALDALISQLPANASLSLDIGNDGMDEWTATVANNSANASPNLAAAFNAYWQSHGAPTTGTLDVPVKVTLDQAGQVLLTNLQVTTAGSKQRAVRLPVQTYSTVNLDFTVGGSGAGPITVALDVGGDGSIDWNGSAENLPVALKTGNLAAAVNAYLATLPLPLGGVGGGYDVPLRIHVSPDAPVSLSDFTTAVATVTDLTANTISVPPPAVGQVFNLTSVADASALSSYRAGDLAPVTATLGNTGNRDSGPVTAAFFATAEGWGDWYIGSDFFANIPAGGSVQAEILWDTTGFSGTTPVKVVVNPYRRVAENNVNNNLKTTSVYIEPPVPPPAAGFTAAPTSGPFPLTVHFTDTSDSQAPITAWQWSFGNGGTSSQQHPSHTYTAAGVYTVTLTVSAASGSDSAVRANFIAVGVPPPPVANFSTTVTAGNAPLNVQFTDLSSGQISSRLWSFGDGATSTEVSPSYTYVASGSYTATLTVSGPGGPPSSKSVGITVSPAQVNVSILLRPGASLVSLPVQPLDRRIGNILAPITGQYTLVSAYDGCRPGTDSEKWRIYDPIKPPYFNTLIDLNDGWGFWINATVTSTLTVVGLPYSAPQIQLCQGWNLVSYPSMQTRIIADALASVNGCYTIVFAFESGTWKMYDPTKLPFFSTLHEMKPGYGYWVYASQSCVWTLPAE